MGRLEQRIIEIWDEYSDTSVDEVSRDEDDYEVTPRMLIHYIIDKVRRDFPKIYDLDYSAYGTLENHCITLNKAIERWFEE